MAALVFSSRMPWPFRSATPFVLTAIGFYVLIGVRQRRRLRFVQYEA